jgi:ribonuclease E
MEATEPQAAEEPAPIEEALPKRRATRKKPEPVEAGDVAPAEPVSEGLAPEKPKRTRRPRANAPGDADADLLPGGPAPGPSSVVDDS